MDGADDHRIDEDTRGYGNPDLRDGDVWQLCERGEGAGQDQPGGGDHAAGSGQALADGGRGIYLAV